MACRCYKFYSVYKSGTDEPVIIHATAKEIQKRLGLTDQTFRTYVSHTRHGTRSDKYQIYVDDLEDE